MRKAVLAVVVLGALSMVGCKRRVPNDIVQKSVRSVMSQGAPMTSSGMCGGNVKGIPNAQVTVKQVKPDNTGVAHVKGTPWMGGEVKPGTTCEGDIEFSYSYTSKKIGRSTRTTWYLDKVKLVAVQTPGVTFKPIDENATDNGDGT